MSAGKLEVSRWKLLLRDASKGREKEFLMERERGKKKGEKAAKNMFSLLAGEVEIGKGTKEGQLDNSVAKS